MNVPTCSNIIAKQLPLPKSKRDGEFSGERGSVSAGSSSPQQRRATTSKNQQQPAATSTTTRNNRSGRVYQKPFADIHA